MNKQRENSIRSLVDLYTVVIGVALSVSAVKLVDKPGGIFEITLSEFLLFLSFVFTLVPFYHGARRHLDDAYLENKNVFIRDGALILDTTLLFAHGMVFVVLAFLLDNPPQFAWILLALILVDVIWGVFAYFGPSTHVEGGAEGKWTLINFGFVIVAFSALYLFDIQIQSDVDSNKLSYAIFIACLLRTMIDYMACWDFYFPSDEKSIQEI